MPAAERARIESEAAARAAREEAQWRDAYSRRVEDKKTQWQQWDAVAAAENAERERQGLTLVHFSAQLKRMLWDRGAR
jgi:hypothetical protein